jgi:plasmid stabilization system protein ParE
VLNLAADDDLFDAAQWYEKRGAGLDVDLIAEVEDTCTRIGDNPELYPELHSDVRRAPVHRFPYGVFYRRRSNYIQVIAIVHDARDPAIWQARV